MEKGTPKHKENLKSKCGKAKAPTPYKPVKNRRESSYDPSFKNKKEEDSTTIMKNSI